MKRFGFTWKREIDLLAGVAFLLAFAMAFEDGVNVIRGAMVRFYAPEVVGLSFEKYAGGKPYLRIAARMAYVNTGAPGYNDTVVREEVAFTFDGGEPYSQMWHSEQRITADGKKLINEYIREAGPFPVAGGNAVSREMLFAPFPVECQDQAASCPGQNRNYLTPPEAMPLIMKSKRINLTFKTHLIGRRNYNETANCYIHAGETLAARLTDGGKLWASVPCIKQPDPCRAWYFCWL